MRLHLQTSHPTGFACMERNEAEKGRRDSAAVPTISSLTQNREVVIIVWGPNTTTKTSPHCKRLTDSICYFIAKDMLPLDTVTNPRFQQMLRTFEPRNSSPDRKTISTHYMPELQEKWHSVQAAQHGPWSTRYVNQQHDHHGVWNIYFQPNPTRKYQGLATPARKATVGCLNWKTPGIHSSNSYYLLIILGLCMGIEN